MTTDQENLAAWAIRVPASSANLGPGFDVLGMAVTLHADVGCGPAPDGAIIAEPTHPASVAFRRLGGEGPLWVRSPIPMGRGLGFSGTVRVGGAAAAVVQHHGREALDNETHRREILEVSAELEGHTDNAAASLYGGMVVCSGTTVRPVPLGVDPTVIAWVPPVVTTSTNTSRAALADTLSRTDAVFNLGRLGLLLTACVTGEVDLLAEATQDRWHQDTRLARVPDTAAAITAALDAGAWAAWLSGSGPTAAIWCDQSQVDEITKVLPPSGQVKVLGIDHVGAIVVDRD